ncbi:ABC transporter ATP-binding protein [Sulfitobacter pseudonitzschiae]|uniref:ABC transporter ATP-binding protein n=1 Tax=Pseudosulfitobacter pseudonitzschiae TaxID=1402135 RepID=A0A9Q2NJ05_9RHOB|nr:ABC transporter ATP-binding protein [Pseudosulfitobacter pseudonitzschiae]MBM2292971.1 ABC transporter ATP-binding protein [Pseudosulfitobacter pseudonitzschiae]MBM2297741.1 ABC transporter ATP-binding protein [Pseudosulfitobacter pseudonitzschiae]MBM2302655.1 ABC transporter ATP-binding protein [Pseudosulfitobacter pseudonitzschiae]MBM2312355.1 ABC transporter ATP-binding protein [Pseudosulfitobacter pseudonitzschiae]MBM2317351.1 ABC transporter ATP-binding protein [Pseudosulfitobacter pse
MLRQFFEYYRPWKTLFWLDFGCAVASGLLELAFPLAIKAFIDVLLPAGDLGLTLLAAFGLLVIYILNSGLMTIVIYWGHMLGINIETEMRRRAFAHFQRLSFSFFDKMRTGKLVARVTRDLEEIGEVAHHGPEDLFIAIMTFVGAFALMMTINVKLALITAVIVPACVVIVVVFGGRMTRTWRSIYARVADFNVRLEENIGGIRVVQAFANEDHEAALFAKDNNRYRETKLSAYKLMAGSSALNYMGMRLIQVVVMLAGAGFVLEGSLSTGGFVAFLLLVTVFFRPLDKIAAVIETYPRGIAGFRRYLELLETEPDVADAKDAVEAPAFKGAVRFEDIGFDYGQGRPVLKGITLDVRPGEKMAFVGQSGAGKTTLLALVPRFYDPQAGRITIDGLDVASVTLNSLRSQIGIVSQDVFLFGGTLRENIAYGRLDASEDDILDAAAKAQLSDMIAQMPDGLDTIVGERGVSLSGGQKQRVAIARIFLKNPPILILDEATSALDTQTERQIQDALDALSENRTTLVIAHRLDTIRNADRIAVMQDGQIVEMGTHSELSQSFGHYTRLANS